MSSQLDELTTGDIEVKTQDDGSGSIFLISDLENHVICDTGVEDEKTQTIEIPVSAEGTEAIYSCSSCGVSFFSVLEHIQQFHNDQEVVVEMEDESAVENNAVEEVELLQVFEGNEIVSQEENQQVVEGEIMNIEQKPMEGDVSFLDKKNTSRTWKTLHEQHCMDSEGRMYTRKIVQIERFWEPKQENVKSEEQEDSSDSSKDQKIQLEEKVQDSKDAVLSHVYHCVKCLNQFQVLQEFVSHKCTPAPAPETSTTSSKYKCGHCEMSYNNSKSLCAHMKVHKEMKKKAASPKKSSDSTTSYKCYVCDTLFPTNKSLRLHSRMHDPIKQRPIEAPVEYKSTSKRATVEDPLDVSGTPADKFHCQLCDKWMHIGYKKVHEMTFHAGMEQYNCEICNRKFFTEENLEMHLTVHNTEKVVVNKSDKPLPYECSYCSRQFSRPHEKVKHERIHTGERPHVCEICGKAFRVSYCLTLHMRTHTGARPYECSHCGKRFKAHSVYNHHVLTHSNIRAYKCPYCPKSFKTSVQLAGHKNAHTKPFSCTECNRPFASLYAVRVHMETHKRQNNLKFNCMLCGASYARAFALKDHIKSHGDVEPPKELFIPEVTAATLAIIPKSDSETIQVVDVVMEDTKEDVPQGDEA